MSNREIGGGKGVSGKREFPASNVGLAQAIFAIYEIEESIEFANLVKRTLDSVIEFYANAGDEASRNQLATLRDYYQPDATYPAIASQQGIKRQSAAENASRGIHKFREGVWRSGSEHEAEEEYEPLREFLKKSGQAQALLEKAEANKAKVNKAERNKEMVTEYRSNGFTSPKLVEAANTLVRYDTRLSRLLTMTDDEIIGVGREDKEGRHIGDRLLKLIREVIGSQPASGTGRRNPPDEPIR